jgi:hypothetical protein
VVRTQNTASQLERTINRWAGDVLRLVPAPAAALQEAALTDLTTTGETALYADVRPMILQSLLRHAMAEAISEGIINCLIVTSSAEANTQLTHIHEHLFSRKCAFTLLSPHFALLFPAPPPYEGVFLTFDHRSSIAENEVPMKC